MKRPWGQRHLDLLQLIRFCALRVVRQATGGISILVDPYQIRKRLGGGDAEYSHQQMWTLLNEIQEVLVEVKTPKHIGHIVNGAVKAESTRINPLTQVSENQPILPAR